ncbi:hypothetical protein [Mucilaginibacter boryungensis]|uniref:SMODS and SLOG-associating 2TM effector domain-containing protein n=1 Tax=Mucilaginibacter boryungensis TaxID=768480 RepID=A0ABR9XIK8_9SPHI|nr:hypothetical protein [Mucilaginibacter boryungensis]MBE9667096.1 hypothetical protein [Mucilaginibacter boryungensis]
MLEKLNNFLIILFIKSKELEKKSSKEIIWEPPKEYCDEITLEEAKFVYDQAIIRFDNTIEISKIIVDRSNILLSVVIGIIIGLVTYSIDRGDKNNYDNIFFTTTISTLYYFYMAVNNLIVNIKPFEYTMPGTAPNQYISDHFYKKEYNNSDKRLMGFYLTELKSLQYKSHYNNKLNKKRWLIYEESLKLLLCSPIIVALIFITIEIISILIKELF